MSDFQESKQYSFAGKKILPIKTVEQLAASYLVAEVIVEIRQEMENNLQKKAIDSMPKLNCVASQRILDLYQEAAVLIKFKPHLVYMLKFAFEDLINFGFRTDSSVPGNAPNDTDHLYKVFGGSYTILGKVNLEDHTLNVFENALSQAKTKGRITSIEIPLVGALLHDFGKSSGIRNQVLGEASARGYKAHAEVSSMYVQDILTNKMYNQFNEIPEESLSVLANLVKNHHPATKALQMDQGIKFIEEADKGARKKEKEQLKQGE